MKKRTVVVAVEVIVVVAVVVATGVPTSAAVMRNVSAPMTNCPALVPTNVSIAASKFAAPTEPMVSSAVSRSWVAKLTATALSPALDTSSTNEYLVQPM